MRRIRLLAIAALSATFLPGCGILFGDRPGICDRMKACRESRRADESNYATPVSFVGAPGYPVGGTIPGGSCAPTGGPPIMVPPGGMGGLGGESLPPPLADNPGRIPPAKIKENPGKQFELEKGTRGPVIAIPASGKSE